MDERHERAARNESIFRLANESIGIAAHRFGSDIGQFVCECSRAVCTDMIELTLTEYESVRAHSDRFAVATGHDDPEVERVVEEHERFSVVEKFGDGSQIAHELDPRA